MNQYYKSKICDDVLKILSEELKISGRVYDIIEAYMKYENHHLKIIKEEYEIGEFPIHKLLQELSLNHLLWDFDAVGLYSSAMSDEKSIYPRTETGYVFTTDMNDELVQKFNNQTFTQGSAILTIKYYNPKNLILQHLPVKEKVNKTEINRMRNGYIIQTLTSVDKQDWLRLEKEFFKFTRELFIVKILKYLHLKK